MGSRVGDISTLDCRAVRGTGTGAPSIIWIAPGGGARALRAEWYAMPHMPSTSRIAGVVAATKASVPVPGSGSP